MNSLLARLRKQLGPSHPESSLPVVGDNPPPAWPAGHFYSPIPSADDVQEGLAKSHASLPGIDLNLDVQKSFLGELERVYPLLKFPETKSADRRYFYQNGSFGALDAVSLAAVAHRFSPKRIVEVGSGHSSAAMLDLRDDGVLGNCEFIFIDPDFSRLNALIRPTDRPRITLVESKVQDVAPDQFRALESGDVLFIDSSHVSKIGSDVNHLVFQIFPVLKAGVIIHLHDVFASFEYPKQWYDEGRYWNEQYLIRAFLMYNTSFEVLFLSGYMFDHYNEVFRTKMPATIVTGGGQLWLRKK